jgi:hypothetical protein
MIFTRVVEFQPDELSRLLKIVGSAIPPHSPPIPIPSPPIPIPSPPLTSTSSPSSIPVTNESEFLSEKHRIPSLTGYPLSDMYCDFDDTGREDTNTTNFVKTNSH